MHSSVGHAADGTEVRVKNRSRTWGLKDAERDWKRIRLETLLELANLPDFESDRFIGKIGKRHYYLDSFRWNPLKYRDELRKIWSGDHSDLDRILNDWIQQAAGKRPFHVFTGRYCTVIPAYDMFPLALAFGVSELLPKMAVCENPECSNRYFIRARKTQRFCEIPACAAYGQREHKRKWWSEHGEKWKQDRIRNSGQRRSVKGEPK